MGGLLQATGQGNNCLIYFEDAFVDRFGPVFKKGFLGAPTSPGWFSRDSSSLRGSGRNLGVGTDGGSLAGVS